MINTNNAPRGYYLELFSFGFKASESWLFCYSMRAWVAHWDWFGNL